MHLITRQSSVVQVLCTQPLSIIYPGPHDSEGRAQGQESGTVTHVNAASKEALCQDKFSSTRQTIRHFSSKYWKEMEIDSHRLGNGPCLLVLLPNSINVAGHSLRPLFPKGAIHAVWPPVTETTFFKRPLLWKRDMKAGSLWFSWKIAQKTFHHISQWICSTEPLSVLSRVLLALKNKNKKIKK